jgi:hypothetical protein
MSVELHFTPDDYRRAADFVAENDDAATGANMLRSAADDLLALRGALQEIADHCGTDYYLGDVGDWAREILAAEPRG